MGCRIKLPALLLAAVSLFTATEVWANSAPIYLESYPSFSIAPMVDAPIDVDQEELTFRIEQASHEAMVTAKYTLTNRSDEKITVPMIFPFVTENYRNNLNAHILYNGKVVDYKILFAGFVKVTDYLKEPERFKQQVDIHTIIENLNQPLYQPKHFDDTVDAVLYQVTSRAPAGRESRISFKLDPDKTRVLTLGFSGFEMNIDGQCVVSNYFPEYYEMDSRGGYLLVLGEDTLKDMSVSDNDFVEKLTVNLKDFIAGTVLREWHEPGNVYDNLYSMFIRELDRSFEQDNLILNEYDGLERAFYNNNISVLLYEVEFAAGSTNDLTITYPLQATIDREQSDEYVNTFAYILNPARNFAGFGGLHIRIELNARDPYIVHSSIPLSEVETGVYVASFKGLPDQDLVFSTYPHPEITYSLMTRLFSHGYGIFFLIIVGILSIVVVGVSVTLVLLTRRKQPGTQQ